VRCADIRSLETAERGQYGTVFANSVFEHVEGIARVLRSCSRLLRAGGTLITTVPLLDMNDHLIVRSARYARFRQHQLQHHNLWRLDHWISEFQAAGFGDVQVHTYLPGRACRTWDALDILGTLGRDRYRVAPAVRKTVSKLLTPQARVTLKRQIAKRLVALQPPFDVSDGLCAALIVGTKS